MDRIPDRTITVRRLRSLAPVVLIAALFLAYTATLTFKSVAGFTTSMQPHTAWPWLADKPVGEDGYYMLTVADNLATTHRLTYNYGLAATGIQPLATFAFAGLAAAVHACNGDRWTLIRAVLLFGALLSLAFSAALAALAARFAAAGQRRLVFTLAFALTLLDFTSFRLFTYGLETGIYLCCLLACLVLWQRIVSATCVPWRDVLLLGLAAGVTGLARIDFGVLFAALLAWLLLQRTLTLLQGALAGLLALAIVSPWFLYVHGITGGWLPTSGSAESNTVYQGYDRLIAWFFACLSHIVPWCYASSGETSTQVLGVLSLLALAVAAIRVGGLRLPLLRADNVRRTFLPWAAAIMALTVIYAAFFASTWFFPRYFAPLLLVAVPLLALGLAQARLVQRHAWVLVAALAVVFAAEDIATLHSGTIGNHHVPAAAYIHTAFPDVRVGAFQSGVIGYLDPNVENLDGKLNLGALRSTQAGHLDQFLDSEQINVLIDWPTYFNDLLPAGYLARGWQTCPKPVPNPQDVCFIRSSFLAAHPEFH